MQKAIIPSLIVVFLASGFGVYRFITQPLIARTETAKLVCDTRLLDAMNEANTIMLNARNRHDAKSLASLIDSGKNLRLKLSEMTSVVESRMRQTDSGARALRDAGKLQGETYRKFIETSAGLAQQRCPARANNRETVVKSVEVVFEVAKRIQQSH